MGFLLSFQERSGEVSSERQTLDIGHWTLDKKADFGHRTLDKKADNGLQTLDKKADNGLQTLDKKTPLLSGEAGWGLHLKNCRHSKHFLVGVTPEESSNLQFAIYNIQFPI